LSFFREILNFNSGVLRIVFAVLRRVNGNWLKRNPGGGLINTSDWLNKFDLRNDLPK